MLELGAGCGLVSICAVASGAQFVVTTDQLTHMAEHNVNANFLPGTTERKRIDVRILRWGNTTDIAKILSLRSGLPWKQKDTNSDKDATYAPYDLILGSDCIYNRRHHAHLATTIDALASSDAMVLW